MSYSHKLEDLIDHYCIANEMLEKKKQMDGVGYLINGHMCFGIYEDKLVVRLGKSLAYTLIHKKGIDPFVPDNENLEDFVMIDQIIYTHPEALHKFLAHSLDVTSDLPPRQSSTDDVESE